MKEINAKHWHEGFPNNSGGNTPRAKMNLLMRTVNELIQIVNMQQIDIRYLREQVHCLENGYVAEE
jgi:hypothetical protein